MSDRLAKLSKDGWIEYAKTWNTDLGGEIIFRRVFEKCEQFVTFNGRFRMVKFDSKNLYDSDDYYLVTREFDWHGNLTLFTESTPSKNVTRTFIYSDDNKLIDLNECVVVSTRFDENQKAIVPRDILNKTNHRNLF